MSFSRSNMGIVCGRVGSPRQEFVNHCIWKPLYEQFAANFYIDVVFASFSSKSWQAKWAKNHLEIFSWWYWIVVAWYHTQVWTWTVSIGHLYMSCPCQSGTQGHLIATKVANNGNYVINRGQSTPAVPTFSYPSVATFAMKQTNNQTKMLADRFFSEGLQQQYQQGNCLINQGSINAACESHRLWPSV